MGLPPELGRVLEAAAADVPGGRLAARVAALSHAYRLAGTAGPGSLGGEDALAYAVYRLPATFAAVDAALGQVADARPDWRPATLLDAGAGPGPGLWAASRRWPSIAGARALEREPAMIALGRRLAAVATAPAVRGARWAHADLAVEGPEERADLVLLTYVLGEIGAGDRDALVARLWRAAAGALVIVEPGTPDGFDRIRRVRHQLTALGGHLLAPCPHADACPMAAGDWCHFAARLGRSRRQRQVKGAHLAYEDEKFSFVAVGRQAGSRAGARVLRHPQARPGHVRLRLCTASGLADRTVARSHGERYRLARRLAWGDRLPWPEDAGP